MNEKEKLNKEYSQSLRAMHASLNDGIMRRTKHFVKEMNLCFRESKRIREAIKEYECCE